MIDERPGPADLSQSVVSKIHPAPQRQDSQLLSVTEKRFQILIEAAPDAIVIVDAEGRIAIVNSQTERIFGYQRSELIGQPVELLLPQELRAVHTKHRAAYTAAPRTRPMGSGLSLSARRRDGSTFPVEISLSAIQTENGRLVTSVIRDITERRQAEESLARQASQLRAQADLLDLAHDAIIVRDLNSAITFWNHGAEEHYGFLRAEALGRISHELLQTRFPQPSDEVDAALFTGGRWEGELIHARRDGTRIIVASRQALQRDESGAPVAILEINNDITGQRRAADDLERRVQQRTAHLNALLQFSQDLLGAGNLEEVLQRALGYALGLIREARCGAIYLYEAAGRRLTLRASVGFNPLPRMTMPIDRGILGDAFSQRSVRIVGFAQEQTASGLDLLRALNLVEPFSRAIALPLVAHDEVIGVLLLLLAGESEIAAEETTTLEGLANLTAAAISEERSTSAAATLSRQLASLEEQQRTMAERVTSAEAAMLQAARLAAVGQLAASIAHEINNPLYAARNCLYLLQEDVPPELRDSQYLSVAREQLARIAGIIDRMRNFSRPDRGEMAPTNLNEMLEGTLSLVAVNTRHTATRVVFTADPNLPDVTCNGDQLRQVFLNLVLNACDAMPKGGTLTIRTVAGPTVALVEVQDTGVGIPADIRGRLFEPFFTNKAQGTGLGLSISAHIVTQHGGQIEVESEEGKGSTFRIALPYTPHR